jgi:hypothetical protein
MNILHELCVHKAAAGFQQKTSYQLKAAKRNGL